MGDIQRPETPISHRASGIRLPHDQSPKSLGELETLLDIDIRSSTDSYIDKVIELLASDGGLFPDSKLPIAPSEHLLHQLSCYNSQANKWNLPDISRSPDRKKRQSTKLQSEMKLADFLNQICEDIATITKAKRVRTWNANFCDTVLEGSPISRKPDIILLDVAKLSPTTWTSVRAITEVTTQEHETKKISNTVTDKSYIILTTQPNRVLVPILSIWGNFNFRVTVTDRQGQLRSSACCIGEPRLADSLRFLRVMIGFCFAPKSVVGYDSTMLTDDWDKVTHIICDGKKFKVIKAIFETQSLVGRATRVWEVEFEGRRLILKDSWIESSRPMAEYKLLQRLQGVEGVSQFFCGEDVCINGEKLSTDIIRQGKWGIRSKVRVRRRIVSSSIGDHIASFRSKRELISALRDITIGTYLSLSLICAQCFFFDN
jgi:hypothetical protein